MPTVPVSKPESVPVRPGAYYPALDGLRAVAVLAVFTVHYLGPMTPLIGNWGALGVDCFFVLSGFLITGILYDSRNRKHRLRDFYARRALRIFPLYYAVWIAIFLLWFVFRWQWSAAWILWPLHIGNWARYIFFDPKHLEHLEVLRSTRHTIVLPRLFVGHFWSLCVEEQFYLLWPLLVFAIRSRRALMMCCLFLLIAEPALRYAAAHTLPIQFIWGEILWRLTPFRLDGLAFGSLLALALRGEEKIWLVRFGRLFTLAASALAATCVGIQVHLSHSWIFPVTGQFVDTVGLGAFSLFFGAIMLELIRVESFAARAFSWTPLRRVGQVSYGFYIYHDLPHSFYAALSHHFGIPGYWPTAGLALCGTSIISFLSFRYLERPALRLKQFFSSQEHTAPRV